MSDESALSAKAHEISVLRKTNTSLNRRLGRLEAALADARRILRIKPGQDGVRWVNGSLGRALLAVSVEDRDELIAKLRAEISAQARSADAWRKMAANKATDNMVLRAEIDELREAEIDAKDAEIAALREAERAAVVRFIRKYRTWWTWGTILAAIERGEIREKE